LARTDLPAKDRTLWMARADEFAAVGHRVLACVRWPLEATWAGGEPDQRGQFMGLMACEDPLRDGVTEALGLCRDAGIRVIMVTGDFSIEDWLLIALIGSLLTALVVFGFDRSLEPNGDVPHARSMALVALTCASAALTAVLSRLKTLSEWIMTLGTLGLSALLVQVPFLAGWLHISPLHWDDWGIA